MHLQRIFLSQLVHSSWLKNMAYKLFNCYVFVSISAILGTQAQWLELDECQTPDKDTGVCDTIFKCKQMLDLLEVLPQPIPPNVSDIIKSYRCGLDENKKPKVCCPSKPIRIPGLTTVVDVIQPPPDVSKHRNIDLLPRNCGNLDTIDKIVYGNKTRLFQYPWMTLLSYRTQRGPQFKCGGTIINNRYILTAAHCVTKLKYKLIGVRVGEYNINSRVDCEDTEEGEQVCAPSYQDLAIEETLHHPDYNHDAHTNDIALLRVATPINLTLANMRPVCLPLEQARNYNFTDRNIVVTGWGATENGRSSPILLKAELPVVPLAECKNLYKNIATINYRQLCAGGSTRSDSCGGDSGGPLHVVNSLHGDLRLVQQGVVSFGPTNCGRSNLPGVYTSVAYFMDWILDIMKP